MLIRKTLLTTVGAFLLTPWIAVSAAQATLFNFSYTLETGDVVSGMLDGTVQANGDDVVVSDIMGLRFNGASPGFDIGFVESFEELNFGPPPELDPVVSFSGSFMDIIACETNFCAEGFLLSTDSGEFGSSFTGFEDYEPARWSLTEKAVPEPAGLLLLGIGLVGLTTAARRRA